MASTRVYRGASYLREGLVVFWAPDLSGAVTFSMMNPSAGQSMGANATR
jgi:hypothetical protein